MPGFAMKTHGQGTATDHGRGYTATLCQAECDGDPACRSWNFHVRYTGNSTCEHIPAVGCPIAAKPGAVNATICGAKVPTVVHGCREGVSRAHSKQIGSHTK